MQRYIANLGTDMLTNPISCSTAHRHAWILWQLTLQTCMQTCLQTLQLFNCATKCMDPTAIHIANIGTDMPTNLTTVQLYMNSMAIRIVNLGADMLTNPIGCSIVHKNAWILWQITLQTLAHTCLQTLPVVQLYIEMHRFYGNSHGKNAWILWQLPWQTLAQTCLQTLQLFNCT